MLAYLLAYFVFSFSILSTCILTGLLGFFSPSSFPSALTYLFALPKLPRHRERSHTHLLTLCFFPLVKCTHILVWATQVNLDIVSACILARSLCSAPPCQVRSHTCSHSPSLPRHLERSHTCSLTLFSPFLSSALTYLVHVTLRELFLQLRISELPIICTMYVY